MHVVVESADFAADAKAAGLNEDEIRRNITVVAERPAAGDLIPGTGGARKIRCAGRGKAASVRAHGVRQGRQGRPEPGERNELRKELAGLTEDYRRGVERYVRSR